MYTPNVYIHVYYNICTVYPRAFHNIEFWQPVLLFEKLSKMLGNEQTARPGVWYKHILRVWIKPPKTRGFLNCCMEKYGTYANTNPLFKEPAQSSVSSPHFLSPFLLEAVEPTCHIIALLGRPAYHPPMGRTPRDLAVHAPDKRAGEKRSRNGVVVPKWSFEEQPCWSL